MSAVRMSKRFLLIFYSRGVQRVASGQKSLSCGMWDHKGCAGVSSKGVIYFYSDISCACPEKLHFCFSDLSQSRTEHTAQLIKYQRSALFPNEPPVPAVFSSEPLSFLPVCRAQKGTCSPKRPAAAASWYPTCHSRNA